MSCESQGWNHSKGTSHHFAGRFFFFFTCGILSYLQPDVTILSCLVVVFVLCPLPYYSKYHMTFQGDFITSKNNNGLILIYLSVV